MVRAAFVENETHILTRTRHNCASPVTSKASAKTLKVCYFQNGWFL